MRDLQKHSAHFSSFNSFVAFVGDFSCVLQSESVNVFDFSRCALKSGSVLYRGTMMVIIDLL